MIFVPTVLILGAGASKPYKYPLGHELVTNIYNNLANQHSSEFQIYQELGFNVVDVINFRESLLFSGKNSVDAFLEHRKEFIEIGKVAIAQELSKYENPAQMFRVGDWYQYFYNHLNTTFEEFGNNNISIITFNYDRSLEHYLFTALKNSYGKPENACISKMNSIPIIHVHGQLGLLPWQSQTGRKYKNTTPRVEDLNNASAGIRIIHEDVDIDSDPEFSKARSVLEKSKRIYFIGFGYHKENITRLRIPPHKTMKGTCYHLEQSEIIRVQHMFDPKLQRFSFAGEDADALLFLRREVVLD